VSGYTRSLAEPVVNWAIRGTNVKGTAELPLKDDDSFRVAMPEAVGAFTLDLAFTFSDLDGKTLSSQEVSLPLLVTYADPVGSCLESPIDLVQLEQAVEWGRDKSSHPDKQNPERVLENLMESVWKQGWIYSLTKKFYPPPPVSDLLNPNYRGDKYANCGKYAEAMREVAKIHGIHTEKKQLEGRNHDNGFITKTGLVSPDGRTGNAKLTDDSKADRWVFGDHVINQYSGPAGTVYFDPTFNRKYQEPAYFIKVDLIHVFGYFGMLVAGADTEVFDGKHYFRVKTASWQWHYQERELLCGDYRYSIHDVASESTLPEISRSSSAVRS